MVSYNYYLLTITTRGAVYTTPYELYAHYCKLYRTKETEFSDLRVFEYSDEGRLHFHTIVISRKYFPPLLKNKSDRVFSHFQLFPSTEYNNIRDYILKQVPDSNIQNNIFKENLLSHKNCFNRGRFLYQYQDQKIFYNKHPIHVDA